MFTPRSNRNINLRLLIAFSGALLVMAFVLHLADNNLTLHDISWSDEYRKENYIFKC